MFLWLLGKIIEAMLLFLFLSFILGYSPMYSHGNVLIFGSISFIKSDYIQNA